MSNQRARVEQLYDSLSEDYRKWSPSAHFSDAHAQTVSLFLRTLPANAPARIAELGCGHGTWLKLTIDELRAAGRQCTALGLDVSAERIRLARDYLKDYPEARVEKADLLRFEPSGEFELVYVFEVFQYFTHAEQLLILRTWLARLVPGGAIVVVDKDRWSRHSLLCEAQKRLGRLDFVMGRLRRYSPRRRDLFLTITYPDFRRLARDLRRSDGMSVQLQRHHEFTSLTVRRSAPR